MKEFEPLLGGLIFFLSSRCPRPSLNGKAENDTSNIARAQLFFVLRQSQSKGANEGKATGRKSFPARSSSISFGSHFSSVIRPRSPGHLAHVSGWSGSVGVYQVAIR